MTSRGYLHQAHWYNVLYLTTCKITLKGLYYNIINYVQLKNSLQNTDFAFLNLLFIRVVPWGGGGPQKCYQHFWGNNMWVE